MLISASFSQFLILITEVGFPPLSKLCYVLDLNSNVSEFTVIARDHGTTIVLHLTNRITEQEFLAQFPTALKLDSIFD